MSDSLTSHLTQSMSFQRRVFTDCCSSHCGVCAAASRVLARTAHKLSEGELHISLYSGLVDTHDTVSMDEVFGSDTETLSCAIEVCNMALDIKEEVLRRFFQNRKRSGGDEIEELYYQDEERRAVITFFHSEGCTALWLAYVIHGLQYVLQGDKHVSRVMDLTLGHFISYAQVVYTRELLLIRPPDIVCRRF